MQRKYVWNTWQSQDSQIEIFSPYTEIVVADIPRMSALLKRTIMVHGLMQKATTVSLELPVPLNTDHQ
jgi:hypothetical protein